ncbi:helix-turn-helix domain-containing protein [Amycolatopsis sp. GM8]|uniref:helix-turn-helix domain-containing protein n=1 Tax=Amycolatopsis sp. GM8 TaxID=2896530 RepID=UPI001F019160|nr:helix-turn-helix domain-containing protein [Amycolatopsis sp. GM8]
MVERGVLDVGMDLWQLGEVTVFRTWSAGIRLPHTVKQAPHEPIVALAVPEAGTVAQPSGALLMTELASSHDFSWIGHGAARCVQIPLSSLGLPVEVARRAGAALRTSPLYRLVARHVAEVTRDPDALVPVGASVGAATVELARALLVSAGRPDALAGPLLARVRGYVRAHLADPALRPATIAKAHNISVRHLYKLCADAGFSLEQWIIGERLEGARAELAQGGPGRPVAEVARQWGFTDPTHFSRRFRAAYGVSAREWRAAHSH